MLNEIVPHDVLDIKEDGNQNLRLVICLDFHGVADLTSAYHNLQQMMKLCPLSVAWETSDEAYDLTNGKPIDRACLNTAICQWFAENTKANEPTIVDLTKLVTPANPMQQF